MSRLLAIPHIRELDFNLSARQAFSALRERQMPFWLDSAMPHREFGQWSYLGCDPFLTLTVRDGVTRVTGAMAFESSGENPFEIIRSLLNRYRQDPRQAMCPFAGGAVGYLGYDMGRYLERLPSLAVDDLGVPDCVFGFYDTIVAFDHQSETAWIVSTGFPETDSARRERRAKDRTGWMLSLLREAVRRVSTGQVSSAKGGPTPDGTFNATHGNCHDSLPNSFCQVLEGQRRSTPDGPQYPNANFTPEQYTAAVERIRRYIIAGDVFEVNLSQRFSVPVHQPAPELYYRLRDVNPAPFACYLGCGEFAVVSSSPERFLLRRGSLLESRPIKGTRRRGRTADEDAALARELLTSEKDRAENIMIVDLVRNDLGRVCEYGSVEVTGLTELERFSSVHHLTSTVRGRLRPTCDTIDAVTALFPGGSITGAPKIRAMEIIDELEPTRRGVYTGSIGWLGFNGDCDLNIAIRTMVVKDGVAHYQAGGAVVFDSDPEQEYIETLHKVRALTDVFRAPAAGVR
ncbi:MAG: aminodeoxychorismate synthase component I [candidate division Zixibacteria bacterium]|jgi:para-aminobenzoate synthetase component 1|nr:aminodeoxychorismate synthase component I [candidate division Zixibacteria bacterium]